MISRDTQPGGTRESAAPKDDEWLFRRCRLRRSRNRRRLPDGITPRIQYPRALADEAEARQPLGAAPRESRGQNGDFLQKLLRTECFLPSRPLSNPASARRSCLLGEGDDRVADRNEIWPAMIRTPCKCRTKLDRFRERLINDALPQKARGRLA